MNNAKYADYLNEQPRQVTFTWKAALYVRLSKEDGDKAESNSVTSQKEILAEYLKLNPDIELYDFYIDATDIIGLKQNPTNGRRFSPIFSFIGHFSIQFEEMLLLKQRRKTEYGKDKAFVDLSKSMNALELNIWATGWWYNTDPTVKKLEKLLEQEQRESKVYTS